MEDIRFLFRRFFIVLNVCVGFFVVDLDLLLKVGVVFFFFICCWILCGFLLFRKKLGSKVLFVIEKIVRCEMCWERGFRDS